MFMFKKTLLAVALAVAATGAAHASTVTECLDKIATLRTTTEGVQSFTNARDEAGLLGKLDMAKDKLNRAKFPDAIQKLTDYYNQVNSLETAAKPKIAFADGEVLKAGALDAVDCVRNIQ